jgi:hypothetical protein
LSFLLFPVPPSTINSAPAIGSATAGHLSTSFGPMVSAKRPVTRTLPSRNED